KRRSYKFTAPNAAERSFTTFRFRNGNFDFPDWTPQVSTTVGSFERQMQQTRFRREPDSRQCVPPCIEERRRKAMWLALATITLATAIGFGVLAIAIQES